MDEELTEDDIMALLAGAGVMVDMAADLCARFYSRLVNEHKISPDHAAVIVAGFAQSGLAKS
jgi:hypothetical protein